ncbi:MAG: gamma-glutamyl-gamma-aminobutyrate hydrolase family protein [Tannerella sp.]|jgi:GMP synthase (glutamine-hydrolysing)|nr:gamma-glutamyl-gamma-aminobutyrate hydrolase family protein [Tannerella sp.]
MNIHFLLHESFETEGVIREWVTSRGHNASYTRFYEGDTLPSTVAEVDFLVIMGGPQSPSTTKAECPYFDAAAEMRFIRACIEGDKAVLGICLGAQLMGDALGATYEHSPEKEIGYFPIHLTDSGLYDPLFKDFGSTLVVGHWHGDMPGLTPDAVVIARSEGCPRQIIRYGRRAYGFQCHLEFDSQTIEPLIEHSAGDFSEQPARRFVQQPDAIRRFDYKEMNSKLFTFLDKFTAI